jgi:cell division septation protein DedD
MADLRTSGTSGDDGFHEIQLNGKQLVFLFMAATVVLVVTFLCGVLVGRGVPLQAGSADAVEAAEPAVVPPPPVAAVTPSSAPPATANENLSYPNRLAGDPPREQLRAGGTDAGSPPPDAPAATPATAPDTTAAHPDPRLSEPEGAGFAIQVTALARREEAEGIASRLMARGYPAYVLPPASGAPAVFRVRVGKFPDRREAEQVASRLQQEEQFKPWIVR